MLTVMGASLLSHAAMAQSLGYIRYEPLVEVPIPAVSGSVLVLLALALALVGFRLLRSRNHNNASHLLVAATLTAALASGISGVNLVADAFAAPPTLTMEDPEGGQLLINTDGYHQVVNDTNRPQQIVAMALNTSQCSFDDLGPVGNGGIAVVNGGINGGVNGGVNGGLNGGGFSGTCRVGLVLQPGDYCDFDVFCPAT